MIDADDLRMIRDAADRLFAQHCSREVLAAAARGEWPADLWTEVEQAGLTRALVAEAKGGAALPVADGLGLITLAAWHGGPIPFAETMVAAWLLDQAGLDVPDGPITIVIGEAGQHVAWVEQAFLVCVSGSEIWLADGGTVTASTTNLAGEPRVEVKVSRAGASVVRAPENERAVEAIMAGVRAMQMAGALKRITELAARYAQDRVQFGKPIAQFQAIQHQLAVLSTQAAVASAAAELACASIACGNPFPGCGIAKARAGEAASIGAGIAHQVHGAIGFTLEHDLQFWTKRLWSWRDEYGTESYWNARFGETMLRAEGDGLWPSLTAL